MRKNRITALALVIGMIAGSFTDELVLVNAKIENEEDVVYASPFMDKDKELTEKTHYLMGIVDEEESTNKTSKDEDDDDLVFMSACELPDSVDLSASKYFPEISRQGALGACASWATTYYALTYQMCKMRNVEATEENTFSPYFSYNLVRQKAGGTGTITAINTLKDIGAVYMKDAADFDDESSALTWFPDEEIWKKASDNRITGYSDIATPDNIENPQDEDLVKMKTQLAEGNVILCTANDPNVGYDWTYTKLDKNSKYAGEKVCVKTRNGDNGLHRMTIVGYDDDVFVDINNDGIIEDGEKGAFKIANSWGKEWMNDGYVWLSYDALNSSSVVMENETNRVQAVRGLNVIRVDDTASHSNAKMVIDMDLCERNNAKFTISAWNSNTAKNYSVHSFSHPYNDNPLALTGKDYFDGGTIVVDLNNVVKDISAENYGDYNWVVIVSEEGESSIFIHSIKMLVNDVPVEEYVMTELDETAINNGDIQEGGDGYVDSECIFRLNKIENVLNVPETIVANEECHFDVIPSENKKSSFKISDEKGKVVLECDYNEPTAISWKPEKIGSYYIDSENGVDDITGKKIEVVEHCDFMDLEFEWSNNSNEYTLNSDAFFGCNVSYNGYCGEFSTKYKLYRNDKCIYVSDRSFGLKLLEEGNYYVVYEATDKASQITRKMQHEFTVKKILPTAEPTKVPTAEPTKAPTTTPTKEPTAEPTKAPTATPTKEPTAEPTKVPTATPTKEPTATPTIVPTPVQNQVTVYYKRSTSSSWKNAYAHYKVNGVWTVSPGVQMNKISNGYWSITIPMGSETLATLCFNNGSGSWDNNNKKNYTVGTGAYLVDQSKKKVTKLSTEAPTTAPTKTPTKAPTTEPTKVPTSAPTNVPTSTPTMVPTNNPEPTEEPVEKKVTIIYKRSKSTSWKSAYVHYKLNGTWTKVPGVKMTKLTNGMWKIDIDMKSEDTITMCFNNGSGSWDNNSSKNYTVGFGEYCIDQENKKITKVE
ncbi:MAG: hypothetical protein K5895_01365 [Lachnospiraceae bacterium]|nr:hypothetical protein [Lachnospiraceae bacterium]